MENDVDIVIAHGNGPSGEYFITAKAAETEKTPAMPLDTCGAMSQGMIGYWMENAIEKALKTEYKQRCSNGYNTCCCG